MDVLPLMIPSREEIVRIPKTGETDETEKDEVEGKPSLSTQGGELANIINGRGCHIVCHVPSTKSFS